MKLNRYVKMTLGILALASLTACPNDEDDKTFDARDFRTLTAPAAVADPNDAKTIRDEIMDQLVELYVEMKQSETLMENIRQQGVLVEELISISNDEITSLTASLSTVLPAKRTAISAQIGEVEKKKEKELLTQKLIQESHSFALITRTDRDANIKLIIQDLELDRDDVMATILKAVEDRNLNDSLTDTGENLSLAMLKGAGSLEFTNEKLVESIEILLPSVATTVNELEAAADAHSPNGSNPNPAKFRETVTAQTMFKKMETEISNLKSKLNTGSINTVDYF